MTSGRAERSRLFRTIDACRTWIEVFNNPEADSSFNSLRRVTSKQVYLLGEPTNGKFQMYVSQDAGATWFIADDPGLDAVKGETAVGSNLTSQGPFLYFGSSSTTGAYVHFTASKCTSPTDCIAIWQQSNVLPDRPAPVIKGVAVQMQMDMTGKSSLTLVAVGESRSVSEGASAFAAFLSGSNSWLPSSPAPDGPLAAVAYDGGTVSWIAVGPSGTYISHDHGKTWKGSSGPGATKWIALSLPYAVGAEGRIGKLASNALQH